MGSMLVAIVMVGKYRGAEGLYLGPIPGDETNHLIMVEENVKITLGRDDFRLFAALRN